MTDRLYHYIAPLTLIILFFISSLSSAATIQGRILDQSGPVKGLNVVIYKTYQDLVAKKTFSTSTPSDNDGVYELNVPEGEYYFTADGNKEGKRYYSYHGNNPIRINKENSWISLVVNEAKPPVYRQGTVSLTGIVMYKGRPVEKARLTFYTADQKSFKGAGSFSQQAEDDGKFTIGWLPPGKYVVIARKSEGEDKPGPLKKGDLFCYYAQNPVEVIQGKTIQIELPCYAKGARSASIETPGMKTIGNDSPQNLLQKNKYGIAGTVRDREGNPMARMYVVAFKSESEKTSTPHAGAGVEHVATTDNEGNYFIPLESDENVRILARDSLGSSPSKKNLFGMYGGNPGKIISFKSGQLVDGINIVVGEQQDGVKKKEVERER